MHTRDSITPGQVWLDVAGNRIHAHGGSLIHADGTFYWYGENKEHSLPGSGICLLRRCYSRRTLLDRRGPDHPARTG